MITLAEIRTRALRSLIPPPRVGTGGNNRRERILNILKCYTKFQKS
jgi:hypothetical protein